MEITVSAALATKRDVQVKPTHMDDSLLLDKFLLNYRAIVAIQLQ